MEMENAQCEFCGENNETIFLRTGDFRFFIEEEFILVKCNTCDLIYLNPRPTAEKILELYLQNYAPNAKESNYDDITRVESGWKKALKPIWYRINGTLPVSQFSIKGRFLDVGCGRGDTLEKAKNMGAEVYGVELNSQSVQICMKKGFDVTCGTLEEVNYPSNFFDTVWMSQVIEHLPHPVGTLREIVRILKPGGRLYIFSPNAGSYIANLFGKYWHGWYAPFHFFIFTEKTLVRLVEKAGLMVETIKTVTPDNFVVASLKSVLFGEAKTAKRPIDRGRILDSIIFRGIISPIFRVLDWVSPGKGDCLMVVVRKEWN
jgi:2-polyprenyl-3-methyl-5-hydroxy-6-metoxy-1,4-benzoquinol methylase